MSTHAAYDDRGTLVHLPDRPRRVVSLVPSITEAIAESAGEVLVGATDWCSHPAGLDVTRVRGTKNPNLALIGELGADLVIGNEEENRRLDVDRMRASGLAVWVTKIETLDEAFSSLRRLFTTALGRDCPSWLPQAEAAWAPAPTVRRRAAIPIWRDPWMVVGRSTFTGDLLARMGVDNVFGGHAERYPHVELEQIRSSGADLVILPDEPYLFTATDGPEAFAGQRTALVSGRQLTWYGPSLVTARAELSARLLR